ncbi:hypothetical protein Q361_10822 [Flavobacterium croceum DSM 17960]|uniref:Uncharacterized protein n=1 Tax=Flavobacterium croceum DSM 17960 TaxID=1121886 RepID=A0A2S4N7M7_9FLAO|nr:hypothetical protein [Flavobacterium croceum]POS01698.1 hypothetical protein Q361_10822 [Flavobacterium croceum DSM 17960]
MKEIISIIAAWVAFIATLLFVISFFMVFFEKTREQGKKLMLYSVIAFIIGFSTCTSLFTLRI